MRWMKLTSFWILALAPAVFAAASSPRCTPRSPSSPATRTKIKLTRSLRASDYLASPPTKRGSLADSCADFSICGSPTSASWPEWRKLKEAANGQDWGNRPNILNAEACK